MCGCIGTVCVCRLKVDIKYFPLDIILETVSLTEIDAHNSTRLAGQQASGNFLSLFLQAGVTGLCFSTWVSFMDAKFGT